MSNLDRTFHFRPYMTLRHVAPAQPGATEHCYRHVLVPIDMRSGQQQALRLGFELSAMHSSVLTVLHVLEQHCEDRAGCWLDAIGLLHDAADVLQYRCAQESTAELARLDLIEFLGNAVPQRLLDAVYWRVACRSGEVAETIASFAHSSAADVVILSMKSTWWWLPTMPLAVRAIERRTRANVILVRK